MKRLLLILCILSSIPSFGQENATLNILGQAKKRVMPDNAVISINLTSTQKSEQESLRGLNEISLQVMKTLKSQGFDKEQIKLTEFSISTSNVYKEKKKDLAYTSTQSFILKFPLDKDRILKLYGDLLLEKLQGVELSFTTEFSDSLMAKIQKELIVLAIADAQEKSELIASATHSRVKSVKVIGYKAATADYDYEVPAGIKFVPPVLKADDEVIGENLNYFTINEREFNEEITIAYMLENRQ